MPPSPQRSASRAARACAFRRAGERRAAPGRRRRAGGSATWTGRASIPRPGSGRPGATRRALSPRHIRHEAPLDLTLRAGAEPAPGGIVLPTGSVRFPAGTRVTDLPGFAAGDFWVQDAAAALPARLLGAQPGERVADLCAAPGGKTAQLAASGASVTAVERDEARLGAAAGESRATAAERGADPGRCGRVVASRPVRRGAARRALQRHRHDPPPSRRAHLKRPRDVQALAEEQDRLLAAAAALLRPGGRLIYAVCSLQPEEGIARVRAAIDSTGLRHEPFAPSELQALPEARTPEGFLRTHPGMWREYGGMDGFFAAGWSGPECPRTTRARC